MEPIKAHGSLNVLRWILPLVVLGGIVWAGAQASASPAERAWSTEIVQAQVRQYDTRDVAPSLAIDSAGRPHIAFYFSDSTGGSYRYGYRDQSGWHIETVDPDALPMQGRAALALDSSGNPHVAYHQSNTESVRYAFRDAGSWHIETVEQDLDASGAKLAGHVSLALDANDTPHLAYFDNSVAYGRLRYAYRGAQGWQIETATTRGGGDASLALDRNGQPAIVFNNHGGGLQYAWKDAQGWHKTQVAPLASDTSLRLDSNDQPHITFYAAYLEFDFRYAYRDQDGWHVEIADDHSNVVGLGTSLYLDADNRPHTSYYQHYPHVVKYAWRDEQGWHSEAVDAYDGSFDYTSIALDSAGNVHVAYMAPDAALKYAHTWVVASRALLPIVLRQPTHTPTPTPTLTPTYGPSPTPTITRTPAPCPQRAGTWRGTADFTVSADRSTVTDFEFEISACGWRWRATADTIPISSDCEIAFAASDGSALLSGSGTFTSDTRISGGWSVLSSSCLGFGSWSSSWRSASPQASGGDDQVVAPAAPTVFNLERLPEPAAKD